MHAAGRSRVNEVMASLVLVGLILACGSTAEIATEIPEEAATPQATIATTPTLGNGSSTIRDTDGMTMMYIPEGEFQMGNDSSNFEREIPAHQVFLDAYWIDQTEITNVMYATCVAADGCKPPKESKSFTYPEYFANADFDDYPVVYVSWESASAYCNWVGGRLPTEAEWEKAARGTDGRNYPWGDGTELSCSMANWGTCMDDTAPVGSYEVGKSPYGLYDTAGNVWEWVNDWYDEFYYQKSVLTNPPGPGSGTERGLRGGAFDSLDSKIRTSYRFSAVPRAADYYIGFRCVQDAMP